MPRPLNLRQIEAFKAVIENGTVSRAAGVFNISQPAMSKLIAHLEEDTGLKLFDRHKGRLAPTEQGMRLYGEIDHIFVGIRQVESAVEAIRREEQGRLTIGVMPALSGVVIQRATMGFLKKHPSVFCSVQARSSEWIAEWLVSRQLDVGIVSSRISNPYIHMEPLSGHPMVCIMPRGHILSAKTEVTAPDLSGVDFIGFNVETFGGQQVVGMLDAHKVEPNTVLVANTSSTICEFVSEGLGVALVHPLMASGWEHRLAVRRFAPAVQQDFQICRSRDSRNAALVDEFIAQLRSSENSVYREVIGQL